MELNCLSPTPGSVKKRKRLGRGESSGVGKTCGKGHKGQKSRSGASIRAGFEGGQMPLYRRIPKIGFASSNKKIKAKKTFLISLSFLNRFDDGAVIGLEELSSFSGSRKSYGGVIFKVVATGELNKKITIKAHKASKSAILAIEKAGGAVELIC